MKMCNTCKTEKDDSKFSILHDRKGRLRLQSKCKECHKEYRRTHMEQERATKAIYRKNNAKKVNDYHVKYNSTRDNGLYLKWAGILKRLTSKVDAYSYKDRGIKCLWKNYPEFRNDMYESFLKHLQVYGKTQTSLDRIDNNGHYCKQNCRWVDWTTQNRNKRPYRNSKNITINNQLLGNS